jgi:imidazolonepropionase-like amidohydrolase
MGNSDGQTILRLTVVTADLFLLRHFRFQRIAVGVAFFFLGSVCQASQASVEDEYLSKGPVFVQNVTVIDGMGNPPVEGRDVLIQDGTITAITATGAMTALADATVIRGDGLTAMPGLIDMHFHLKGGWSGGNALQDKYPPEDLLDHSAVQQTLAALLYAGVTTALDLGRDHDWIVEQRDKINTGEYVSPRYFIVGVPFSQEPSGWDEAVRGETVGEPTPDALSTKVDTQNPEALGALLDRYLEDDIHIIKLYSGISALAASFLIKEAEKRDITAIADLWQLNMNASWMRMTGLHGWAHASPYPVSKDSLEWMAENDRFVVATMNVGEKMSGLRVKDDGDKRSFFENNLIVDIWGEEVVEDFYASYPDVRHDLYEGPTAYYQVMNFGDLSTFRDEFLRNIRNAHEAGVLIAGGTDAPAYPTLWTGETMHRELELFVMAGISPIDAIQMCTYNAARILQEEDQFGSIQVGLSADIMLVEGKPWDNVSDTRNIEHVIVRGGILDREKLLTSWH